MDETRAALADKLGVLERQVTDTVETVKDSVNTVRNTFDVKAQVRKRPWAMLAGAAALGLAVGYRTSAGRGYRRSESVRNVYEARYLAQQTRRQAAETPEARSPVAGAFEKELSLLKGLAVGAVLGVVRDMALRSVSGHAEHYLETAIDGVTRRLGGQPVPRTKPETPAPESDTREPPDEGRGLLKAVHDSKESTASHDSQK